MTEEEKQKCWDCAIGSFVCEHNKQFEPLDTGEIEKFMKKVK